MKKQRKQIILLSFLLLVLLIIQLAQRPPAAPTFVYGNIPGPDVAEIESVVRHNIKNRFLPNHSWASIKNIPRFIKTYAGHHIASLSKHPDGTVEVNVRYNAKARAIHVENYTLQATSDGYVIVRNEILVN